MYPLCQQLVAGKTAQEGGHLSLTTTVRYSANQKKSRYYNSVVCHVLLINALVLLCYDVCTCVCTHVPVHRKLLLCKLWTLLPGRSCLSVWSVLFANGVCHMRKSRIISMPVFRRCVADGVVSLTGLPQLPYLLVSSWVLSPTFAFCLPSLSPSPPLPPPPHPPSLPPSQEYLQEPLTASVQMIHTMCKDSERRKLCIETLCKLVTLFSPSLYLCICLSIHVS